jgi:hypothetical protein
MEYLAYLMIIIDDYVMITEVYYMHFLMCFPGVFIYVYMDICSRINPTPLRRLNKWPPLDTAL